MHIGVDMGYFLPENDLSEQSNLESGKLCTTIVLVNWLDSLYHLTSSKYFNLQDLLATVETNFDTSIYNCQLKGYNQG